MRLAMIRLNEKMIDKKLTDSKMLLQIHDELIFEVPEKDINSLSKVIKQEMMSVKNSELHSFSIPLSVDINTGENWGMLH